MSGPSHTPHSGRHHQRSHLSAAIPQTVDSGFDLLQKPIGIASRPAGHPLFSDEAAEIRHQAFAILEVLAGTLSLGRGIHVDPIALHPLKRN